MARKPKSSKSTPQKRKSRKEKKDKPVVEKEINLPGVVAAAVLPEQEAKAEIEPRKSAPEAPAMGLIKWQRFFRRLFTLSLFLIVLATLGVSVAFALPGDIGYFPKRLIEEQWVKMATTPDAKWKAYSQMLYDRLRGLKALDAKKSCAQYIVVEADFLERLHVATQEFGFATGQPRVEYIRLLGDISEYVGNYCGGTILAKEWKIISQIGARYYINSDLGPDPVYTQRERILYKQQQLLVREREAQFTDQSLLNNVTQLLLKVQKTSAAIKGMEVPTVELYDAELSLQNTHNLLSGSADFTNYERLVAAACRLMPENPDCNAQALQGKFNSINAQTAYVRRLEGGRKLFNSLMNELLKREDPDKLTPEATN